MCYISWVLHAAHIRRAAVCEMYFAGQVHRDAPRCVQPQNAETSRMHLSSSIYPFPYLYLCLYFPIYPSVISLYLYLFLFKRHDNSHGNSEILASWRSALDTFRELASALIEALGLVENLINVRRTRSVRARSLPPHLLCVRVATAFYTRFVFLLFAKHSTCLCCSTKWTREPDFPDVIISLLRSSTFLDSLVR